MESKFKRIVSIVITIAVIMTMTVTPGFAQDAAGEEIIPENTVTYTYSQEVGEDEAGYNDELFEKYVEAQLYSGIEGYSTKKVMLKSVNLSEMNQMIFDRLKEQISEVAAGNSTSTVFKVSYDDLGIEGASWTAAELGVSSSATANELYDAVMSKLGIDLNRVYDALVAECAYELYWHDKTAGISTSAPAPVRSGSGSSMRIGVSGEFTFKYEVAEAYSAGEYTVNTENIDRVHNAVENANAAVSKAAILTDDEKLTLYKSEICGLVTYDTAAAEDDSTPYGDQWQLISVFDCDDTTNVVCEGYSKAFKYLCDLTEFDDPGIECILVSGNMRGATGAGAHMWNIVTINGENYLVDVTNCDDGTIGAPDQLFLKGNENGSVTDGYTFTCEGGNVSYAYDEKTMSLYVEELELAKADYGGNIVTVTDGMLYTVIGGNAVFMGYDELLPDHVIIPEEIDGYPVTSIGRSAFYGNSDLTQIYIPVGVVFIRPEAFESSGLEKIYYQGTAEEWENVSKDSAGLAGEVEILTEAELAEGHVYCGEYTVATPATCTEDGNETRKCRFCEELQTKALPALGHSWGEWTVVTEATASEDGLKRRVCANDASHVEEEVIPKLGNVVTEKYVESMEFEAMPRLRKDVDASLSATAFDGDTVTLNYSDGSSEVYVLKNPNFISQTTETTTDESERISISYDEQNHVDFASYNNGDVSLRADDPGASYVAQSIELTSSGPVELIRGLDSVTKTDASGNEYEEYNIERLGKYSKFLENDSFKVTYKNGLDEEITVDYVYTDSTGGFTLAEDNPYYTGYPSDNYFGTYFEIELPDQSVDHFEVGQTYYMDVTYHETGSNFELTPITTAGKPYSLKITQAGPEDVTSISFTDDIVYSMKKGETADLSSKVEWEPEYAVVTVEWSSSKPSVASVDENGTLTALSGGFTEITAKIGEKEVSYTLEVIEEKILSDETVSLSQTVFPYTGINVDINKYVLYNGILVPSSNLSTQYSQRPLNIGDYTATITGVYGNYSGSATESFTIKGDLSRSATNVNVTLDSEEYVYEGSPVEPEVVSVTAVGKGGGTATLTEETDYTVSYMDNNAAGTGYVVITAVDDSYYMDAKRIPFTITEKGTEPEPEEPKLTPETLWDKTEYWSSPHFTNVEDPGALEIISVVSSDTSVLGVECVGEGGNIYDYILTPVKPGTSTVTVTYKLDGKEATASAVYTVKEFPEFITELTVDGEKADAEVYTDHNYYDINGYEGTAPNIRLTIADGWVLDNAYWNVTVDGELEEYFSGSEIPENGWTYEFPENGTQLNAFFVFKNTEGDNIQFGVRFIRDGGSGPVEPVPEMTASINENGILSWESVEGATQYEVTVPGNYNIYYENTADIKYLLDLAYKNGDLEGYTSPYSVRLEAAKVVPTGEDTFDYYLLGEWEGTFDYDPAAGGEVEKYVESMEFKAMPRLRKDVDASLSATAFDGDTVTLNYSDGSSEVYVLNNWNFIAQTTETTTDESARISISYDKQNHVDFASYNNGDISLRADDPGASYVAQSIELTSSGPVELIRGLDSVTKTDASGNEYEEYNLERLGRYSKFLENDSFKVTYKNGLDEEITVDYVHTDSTGGFTLAEGNPYYTGYPSDNYFGTYFEIELPDQSVDHFEVGQTYYMDVTYHETGSNFELTPITTAGKPYSLKITQAGPEDVTSISFANSNVEKVKKGETLQLGVNWEPSYAVVPEGAMTWTSSNPAVATVDGNGLVTAVSEGSVLITAEINGKKAYKNVEVYDEKVLSDETVSLAQTVFPYTGINVDINQYVLYNGTLVPRSNLSTQYSQRPLNIGDYTATITGVYGGYSGSATKSFTIKGNLAGTAGNPTVTLDPADGYVYSGEPVKPTVTSVTFNGTTLTEGKDYTVSYENNNAAGTGYVVITAVDDSYYMGAKLIPFTITEPGPEEPVVVIEEVERIYGASRFDTALKVADELKERMGKEKYDAVILAFSHNYADALAGSYLSCAINAPILLVNSKQDNIDSVQSYIKENLAPGGTIYMLGGTAVVPEAAVKGLTGFNTKRLWGKDRYETNVAILKEAAQFTNDTEIIVASGNGFADSLSAAATGKPILLVKNTLQPVQKEYLNSLEGDLVFDIIGGTGAVSDAVMKELNAYGSTNRTGGATRYETSVNVAKKFFDDPEVGVLAYGQDFPDGLCGGALAHAFGGPLILTANGRTDAAVEYANETGMKFGAVLGGPTLISDASAKDIYNMGAGDKIEVK